jgi:hypothetical protein
VWIAFLFSVMSFVLPLSRLVVDGLDKIVGLLHIAYCMLFIVLVFGPRDLIRVLSEPDFSVVNGPTELWGVLCIPCYFRGRRWTA